MSTEQSTTNAEHKATPLSKLIESLNFDLNLFETKQNVSAGRRARKCLQEITKYCKATRKIIGEGVKQISAEKKAVKTAK